MSEPRETVYEQTVRWPVRAKGSSWTFAMWQYFLHLEMQNGTLLWRKNGRERLMAFHSQEIIYLSCNIEKENERTRYCSVLVFRNTERIVACLLLCYLKVGSPLLPGLPKEREGATGRRHCVWKPLAPKRRRPPTLWCLLFNSMNLFVRPL